ncbi:MAG: hypothetical protein JRD89_17260 [Deltaproteobacteria bacterium]|nr:hypothetical protein [Deltaproteobacteria bacterium]
MTPQLLSQLVQDAQESLVEKEWFLQRPKLLSQVVTTNEAAAYAHGSYLAAKPKCPGIAANYEGLKQDVLTGQYGAVAFPLTYPDAFRKAIQALNVMCNADKAYAAGSPSDIEVISKGPASTAAMGPPAPLKSAGVPWWLWLVGGAAAYYLTKKKK